MLKVEDGKIINKDEILQVVEGFLSDKIFTKLPKFARKKIIEELNSLKQIVLQSRLPKIAIIGRTQSGKSSLIKMTIRMSP